MICVESTKKIMEIFDGKWSFLIIGELHAGTKRFNEMNRSLGISTKALSDALKNLESSGIITRTVYPTSPVTVEYSLTEKGRDFERVFVAMREWELNGLRSKAKLVYGNLRKNGAGVILKFIFCGKRFLVGNRWENQLYSGDRVDRMLVKSQSEVESLM